MGYVYAAADEGTGVAVLSLMPLDGGASVGRDRLIAVTAGLTFSVPTAAAGGVIDEAVAAALVPSAVAIEGIESAPSDALGTPITAFTALAP